MAGRAERRVVLVAESATVTSDHRSMPPALALSEMMALHHHSPRRIAEATCFGAAWAWRNGRGCDGRGDLPVLWGAQPGRHRVLPGVRHLPALGRDLDRPARR